MSRIAGGDIRTQAVARVLNVSARTLQRRLAEEGVTQALVDRARKDAASRYLGNANLAIGEVAYLVGFSEPAPFHRAFKQWFGCYARPISPPAAWCLSFLIDLIPSATVEFKARHSAHARCLRLTQF